MKKQFTKLPYSNLYFLSGLKEGELPPKVFVDDVTQMMYTYSHVGFEGPTYYGKEDQQCLY